MNDYVVESQKEALELLKFGLDEGVMIKGKYRYALAEGMVALEKQIPITVSRAITDRQEVSGCHETCPACGKFVYDDYCGRCGQKLDWR